jgi:hypothetical protein
MQGHLSRRSNHTPALIGGCFSIGALVLIYFVYATWSRPAAKIVQVSGNSNVLAPELHRSEQALKATQQSAVTDSNSYEKASDAFRRLEDKVTKLDKAAAKLVEIAEVSGGPSQEAAKQIGKLAASLPAVVTAACEKGALAALAVGGDAGSFSLPVHAAAAPAAACPSCDCPVCDCKCDVAAPVQPPQAAVAPAPSAARLRQAVLGMAKSIDVPNAYRFVRSLRTVNPTVQIVIFADVRT